MAQQPLPPPPTARDRFDSPAWQGWIMLLVNRLTKAGQILWSQLDFTGSNLANLATRNHNDLQGMQGGAAGEYNHLTNAQLAAIGSGSTMKSKTIATADTTTVTAGFELAYSDDLFLDGSIEVAGQAHIT